MQSFWNKTDVFTAYGCKSGQQFERRVGAERLALIGWEKGNQFFTPNELRKIFEVLGEPLNKAEIRG